MDMERLWEFEKNKPNKIEKKEGVAYI